MKRFVFFLLRFSGAAALFRTLFQKRKVTILLFHDLDAQVAERAFVFFGKYYNLIDLDTFVSALENRDHMQLPDNALIITFDDGHIGNYQLLPSIVQHQIPVTIFVCASIVGTHRHFWFVNHLSPDKIQAMKRVSNRQRLSVLAKVGFDQGKSYEDPHALQVDQIKTMASVVDFQAHTHFHPILPACDDNEAEFEIKHGKIELEKKFGFNIDSFAYPNGDYSERDVALVKQAGYKSALTVDFGFNDLAADPFRLKRIPIRDTLDMNELIVKASGLWSFLKTRNGKKQTHGLMKLISDP